MARRRFQNPEPKRDGKWWYLLPWQDEIVGGSRVRKRKRIKLAPATMPVREVKKIAAEYLRPLNQGLQTIGSATTFGSFVDSTYTPLIMPLLASTTRERSAGVIKNYLIPAFGSALPAGHDTANPAALLLGDGRSAGLRIKGQDPGRAG